MSKQTESMPALTNSTSTALPDTLFSAAIDRAPEAILLTSSTGTIVYVNKLGLQLLGYPNHELLGRSIVEINTSVSNGNWAEIVESTANSGSATRRSMVQARDGSAWRVDVTGSAVQQAEATVLCFILRRVFGAQADEPLSDLFALSTAFYATPDPMIVVSESDDTVVLVNDAFESVTGYRGEDALFRTTTEFDLWCDPEDYRRLKARLTNGSPTPSTEAKIRTRSGEIRHASVSASRLQHQQDVKTLLILRDITHEKRTEEALRSSEAMFARVFRSSPHLVSITTLAGGVFVDVNEAFERTSGYSRSEIVGRTAVEMDVWASETERAQFAEVLAETGSVRDMDFRWRIKSGEVRVGRLSAEMIELGGKSYIVSVAQDITDFTAAEEARRRSEERFSKAFRGTPHLAAITSLETGEFIDVNDGFEQISGYKRSEVIGRRTLDFNLWETPERRARFVEEIRRNGRVHEQETRLKNRAGEAKIGLISAQPIEIDNEECIITVIQDITGRKKTEDALKDYAQRLKTLREID
ncbi:MAG: PAS domain S-box protein, partial [Rhodothermales bacterium]|nr:PAS domain S-box protein [Rhodothermales bacterium]